MAAAEANRRQSWPANQHVAGKAQLRHGKGPILKVLNGHQLSRCRQSDNIYITVIGFNDGDSLSLPVSVSVSLSLSLAVSQIISIL